MTVPTIAIIDYGEELVSKMSPTLSEDKER